MLVALVKEGLALAVVRQALGLVALSFSTKITISFLLPSLMIQR